MHIPSFPTYLSVYILTKSEFISSCIRPAVGSNIVQITRATFFVNVFTKIATGSHFGCPNITSYHFRYHFNTTIFIFVFFFTKWLPADILDVRISLSMAFLAISDQYETLYFFLQFLTKWLPSAILDVRNSLSITFLAILCQYGILFYL